MKKLFFILLAILAISACTPSELDRFSKSYDMGYTLKANGIGIEEYTENLEAEFERINEPFAKGDILLMLGRLENEPGKIFLAMDFYHRAAELSKDWEEKAVLFETIASIEDSSYYFIRAADAWQRLDNDFRAKLNFELAMGTEIEWQFNLTPLEKFSLEAEDAERMIIGGSRFELDSNSLVVSQVDRVTRDWISYQLQNPSSGNLLKTFSERLIYSDEELLPSIGWHEGGRLLELKEYGINSKPAVGTILKKKGSKWYAPNEKGVFMFEVPKDKVLYPTTRFLREDIALVVDTHGMNMIVAQALRNDADAVIACCDHKGKVKAAKYLSDRGVKVICNTDKYLPLLLGSKAKVLGSAPYQDFGGKLVFGSRPIEIGMDEPVVVLDTSSEKHGMSYYDTPARYFRLLEEKGAGMNVHYVFIDGFNQLDKLVSRARKLNADIIAARVFNSDDYRKLKQWLLEDLQHKVILFHSEAYPYGYKLAREFRSQTSFDDIRPVFL